MVKFKVGDKVVYSRTNKNGVNYHNGRPAIIIKTCSSTDAQIRFTDGKQPTYWWPDLANLQKRVSVGKQLLFDFMER